MSVLSPKQTSHPPESGMIAIMVTLIMMIVISLLVLGFAQVSRHEQRNTLDNQLSSQAYYAAESGVNDAASAIRLKLDTGKIPARQKCNDNSNYNFTASSQLGPDVSYSCVLIDPAPMKLNYAVGSNPVVVPMESGSGVTFKTITVSWTPIKLPDGTYPANPLSGCPNAAGSLPPMAGSGAWSCGYSMLRTEMVPTTVVSRSSLLANSKVNFLEPVTSSPGTAVSSVGGKVIPAKCVGGVKPTCQVVFSGLTGPDYYMRLSAIYGTTNVTVTASDLVGPVGIAGAQVDIDVTGNAHGVLRRVLVAVDLTDANRVRLPSAALAVGDTICKRFAVADGLFLIDSNLPGGNGNPLCTTP
jgi:Tfp pilus assembly protein PilX